MLTAGLGLGLMSTYQIGRGAPHPWPNALMLQRATFLSPAVSKPQQQAFLLTCVHNTRSVLLCHIHSTLTLPCSLQAQLHHMHFLLFNPEGDQTAGLHLLALAATSHKSPKPDSPSLAGRGPFNWETFQLLKVVKKILNFEFVEMLEIKDPPQIPGHLPAPPCPLVEDSSTWVECCSLMTFILVLRFPEKAPETFCVPSHQSEGG